VSINILFNQQSDIKVNIVNYLDFQRMGIEVEDWLLTGQIMFM